MQRRYQDEGFRVLAVDVDGDKQEFAKYFTQEMGWPEVSFPILLDDDDQAKLGERYSFEGVPRIYLLDRDQRIRYQPAELPSKASTEEFARLKKEAMARLTQQIEATLEEDHAAR